jgi:hypothetical protein
MTQLDLDAMRDKAISELEQRRLVVPASTTLRFYARIRELEELERVAITAQQRLHHLDGVLESLGDCIHERHLGDGGFDACDHEYCDHIARVLRGES